MKRSAGAILFIIGLILVLLYAGHIYGSSQATDYISNISSHMPSYNKYGLSSYETTAFLGIILILIGYMMAREKRVLVCSNCGTVVSRKSEKCGECGMELRFPNEIREINRFSALKPFVYFVIGIVIALPGIIDYLGKTTGYDSIDNLVLNTYNTISKYLSSLTREYTSYLFIAVGIFLVIASCLSHRKRHLYIYLLECPECHGLVGRKDRNCPHCDVELE